MKTYLKRYDGSTIELSPEGTIEVDPETDWPPARRTVDQVSDMINRADLDQGC